MEDKVKYFTFPIALLLNGITDIKKVCDEILNYSFYFHATNKLNNGTLKQRINASAKYFNYTIGSIERTIEVGRRICDKNYKVVTSVRKDIIEDFRLNYKTEFEVVSFLAFCGLRSIIGVKPYCKTENQFLLSRMCGYEKKVPLNNRFEKLSDTIKPYANEYQMKKIKNELVNNWGLKYYSRYTRGFYVSFKLTLEELIEQAEKRRKKYLEKNKSEVQKEAIKKVMLKLYGSPP